MRSSTGDNGRRFGQAKVVNTSLLVYQRAAGEEEKSARERERERERVTFHRHTIKWVSIAQSRVQPLYRNTERDDQCEKED